MVEKSTVDKKQQELYPKLKRIDPRILKRAASRIDPDVEAADRSALERLAALGPGPKVLSVYINLDPGQFWRVAKGRDFLELPRPPVQLLLFQAESATDLELEAATDDNTPHVPGGSQSDPAVDPAVS